MKSSSPTVYSSALSSKGALLDETLTILRQIDAGCGVDEVRGMVMDDDLLHKTTMYTRRSSWNNIHARFLIDPEFATLLSSMVVHAPDRQTGRLILLYEFCRSSAILHDTTVHCIYPRYAAGYSAISTADMQNHFDDVSAQHPELADWSPQTRDKVASNILTILRDFGLLRGARPKQFARLYVSLPAFVYVLYRIAGAEATSAEETVNAEDWRIFLLEEADVLDLLEEATAVGHCVFKHLGDIRSLDLRYPSLEACVEALTS